MQNGKHANATTRFHQVIATRAQSAQPEPRAPLEILLTPREVADVLGLSESAVLKRMARGQIPAVRLGARGFRVKRSALENYLANLPEV